MPKTTEIKSKINSIKKTYKITNAMQMVSAGKKKKAENYMYASMPYSQKIKSVIEHIINSNSIYNHINKYFAKPFTSNKYGFIVISTNKGLCGGLNINLFKNLIIQIKKWDIQNINLYLIGNKANIFFKNNHIGNIRTSVKDIGDKPSVSSFIGTLKVVRDDYENDQLDKVFIVYNEFVSTMIQKPKIKQILPLREIDINKNKNNWDYIYEPKPNPILKELIIRYLESQIYQAVVDNIACEQSARMITMKNATDNAKNIVCDLQSFHNQIRQSLITQEISEIISGIPND